MYGSALAGAMGIEMIEKRIDHSRTVALTSGARTEYLTVESAGTVLLFPDNDVCVTPDPLHRNCADVATNNCVKPIRSAALAVVSAVANEPPTVPLRSWMRNPAIEYLKADQSC